MVKKKNIRIGVTAYSIFGLFHAIFMEYYHPIRHGMGGEMFVASLINWGAIFLLPLIFFYVTAKIKRRDNSFINSIYFSIWVSFPISLIYFYGGWYGTCRNQIGQGVFECSWVLPALL